MIQNVGILQIQILGENNDRGILDGQTQVSLGRNQISLGFPKLGDIVERDDEPFDPVVLGAVRLYPAQVVGVAEAVDRFFPALEIAQNEATGLDQIAAVEFSGQVGDGSADVRLDEVEEALGSRGEPLDAQFFIEENRGDIGAGEQVVYVVVTAFQLRHLGGQLLVHRVEFFVQALQLLP